MYIIHLYIIYKLHIHICIYNFYFKGPLTLKSWLLIGETQIVKHTREANTEYLWAIPRRSDCQEEKQRRKVN